MRLGTDTGNFVMLLLAAGLAGVFLGDWAFKTVLVIGVVGMVIGTVAYARNAFGANKTSSRQAAAPAPETWRTASNPDKDVEALLRAVSAKDQQAIERLVLTKNVSPFQNAPWQGTQTSARALAEATGYASATAFFAEWSDKGSAARLSNDAQSQSSNS